MTDWSAGQPIQAVWGQVKARPESTDGGIDFEYQWREAYPMLLSADRPFLLLSSLSEGAP